MDYDTSRQCLNFSSQIFYIYTRLATRDLQS